MIKRVVLLAVLLPALILTTGCLSKATVDHMHTKVNEVELRTRDVVEANIDDIVLDILKRLDARLEERGIEIPEEFEEILVAEAQKMAREYALKGVEIGFREIHDLIDKVFVTVPTTE